MCRQLVAKKTKEKKKQLETLQLWPPVACIRVFVDGVCGCDGLPIVFEGGQNREEIVLFLFDVVRIVWTEITFAHHVHDCCRCSRCSRCFRCGAEYCGRPKCSAFGRFYGLNRVRTSAQQNADTNQLERVYLSPSRARSLPGTALPRCVVKFNRVDFWRALARVRRRDNSVVSTIMMVSFGLLCYR